MRKLSKVVAALPFAHLLGMAAKAEDDKGDDDKKQRADESDEDYATRMEDDEEEDDGKKKDAKAEGDDKDDDKGDPDDKDDEDKEKKAKKASKADAPEDDKEKAARKSERARCAAIFKCSAAGVRPDVAAHLAFSTDMSSAEAVSMLETVAAGGAPQSNSLASRMAGVKTPNVGTGGGSAAAPGSSADAAAQIIAAGKIRRGEA